MHVREATNSQEWNTAVKALASPSNFLQSWEWGEFQSAYGRPVFRFLVENNGVVVLVMSCVVMKLPFGRTYLLAHRGPLMTDTAALKVLQESTPFREMCRQYRVVFLRIEPIGVLPVGLHAVADMQPALTTMLALNADDEAILAGMKQKTRYNIRLSAKKEVEVAVLSHDQGADWSACVEEMYELIEATSKRHDIGNHSLQYYIEMVSELAESGMLEILKASHAGDTLAMNMLIHFGDTTTYLHGASSDNKKHMMAPYALQWAGIQRAKELGSNWYDFYGIGPEGDAAHKLAGVTRFKTGFGGEEYAYHGTYELELSYFWYTIYRIAKRIRS